MTENPPGDPDDVTVEPVSGDPSPAEPGHDEVFCVECGEIIKERAEICPECGVRQQLGGPEPEQSPPDSPDPD